MNKNELKDVLNQIEEARIELVEKLIEEFNQAFPNKEISSENEEADSILNELEKKFVIDRINNFSAHQISKKYQVHISYVHKVLKVALLKLKMENIQISFPKTYASKAILKDNFVYIEGLDMYISQEQINGKYSKNISRLY